MLSKPIIVLLALIPALLSGCANNAEPEPKASKTAPLIEAPNESSLLAQVSTEALIKEYVARRDAAILVFPPKFDFKGVTSADEMLKKQQQYNRDMADFGRELLRQSIIFADAGFAPAQGIAANFLWDKSWAEVLGRDVCRSLQYAFDGALGNNPFAMAILADAYRRGDGIQKDEKRAYFWARETMHRYWPNWPYEYKIEEIVNQVPPDSRAKLDQEWMEWPHVRDIREQRKEVCKKD